MKRFLKAAAVFVVAILAVLFVIGSLTEAPSEAEAQAGTESKGLQVDVVQNPAQAPLPASMKEAKASYASKDGTTLAGAPKIQADGGLYHIYGRIDRANGGAEFLAALPRSTDYYVVIVPDAFRAKYNGAQIKDYVGIVGRYVANRDFKTVLGQPKSMPVFEAVYFELNPKSPDQEYMEEVVAARIADDQKKEREEAAARAAEAQSVPSAAASE